MLQSGVPDLPITPDALRRLARLVESHALSELRYEEDGLRVTLRTGRFAPSTVPIPAPTDEMPDEPPLDAPPPIDETPEPDGLAIEAPLMGVFYRSPGPSEPPFIEVGDTIEAGQPIGMIEAMKVFSEVLAETAGVVRAIPAPNGALVQPGDPLVILEGI
jgi:acetyl-CoA carboxylase biotin carboxyl carrier protein